MQVKEFKIAQLFNKLQKIPQPKTNRHLKQKLILTIEAHKSKSFIVARLKRKMANNCLILSIQLN